MPQEMTLRITAIMAMERSPGITEGIKTVRQRAQQMMEQKAQQMAEPTIQIRDPATQKNGGSDK